MGPDKSCGPDGFTTRFLQQNWGLLGQEICTQIRKIFHEGEVPKEWLKCHVTLIPKSPEPQTPAEYRPISVGNVFYRLFMKLIARRLRSVLKNVISQEQNAFLKGRSISDNIILVKEILHSFSQTNFKQKAFLLKADINKAFDKLDWSFLEMALVYLNVPQKIIKLVLSSYKQARVTIKINGKGDGFIKPTRGLRQGCPMSPYIFIIAMEMMSRVLLKTHDEGRLKGVHVAKTSPAITHAIYADDLVIMGDSSEQEIHSFQSILNMFAEASGLCINPQKSKLWFSRGCNENIISRVQQKWGAVRVSSHERYLGIMLDKKGDTKHNGRMLVEKLKGKLAGWKANMLSHAGRLVLIKSVLMSMPVYVMTIQLLPKGILKEINSLLAKFFWGKLDRERYLTFISWKRVCKPIESGGLGVKDIDNFGQALFLKLIWSLMADENKLWVKVCKSKYYPTVGYWRSRRNRRCSKVWNQTLALREVFKEQVLWHLENGKNVTALSQPWFQGWTVQEVASPKDRKIRVSELVDGQTGQWKVDELSRLFQHQQVQQIITSSNKPNPQSEISDRLVWRLTKSGRYAVKEGYKMLLNVQERAHSITNFEWGIIWKWKNIEPRVKIFLWRLVNKGLPMGVNMHVRMNNLDPICQRCHQESEYEMHCLFFCETSRQVWFGGQLGLRVHDLPLNIDETVQQVMNTLNEDEAKVFAITMWEIWKERNKAVIEKGVFKVQDVIKRVNAKLSADMLAQLPLNRNLVPYNPPRYEFDENGWQVLVDASWQVGGKAGGAYVIYDRGKLHSVGLHTMNLDDPFHAEAEVLKNALCHMYESIRVPASQLVQFFSDCLNLVIAVNQADTTDLPSRSKPVPLSRSYPRLHYSPAEPALALPLLHSPESLNPFPPLSSLNPHYLH
ncbi:hypothetical protein LUZ61_003457 [Rhynchospora tenuis]|uniref:Reverse transcriptase domain-containing protein n=1 Tax=Rhynchospora tenuis TaxID=198213 RepID=A0AAD5ZKV0_9POAL|nr:hypothetical protein LUZ61_003457 [Rhynchospora tenuis]